MNWRWDWTITRQLFRSGLTDPAVLMLGTQLLRWLSVSGLFITVALTCTGGLTGTGDTRAPLTVWRFRSDAWRTIRVEGMSGSAAQSWESVGR